MLLWERTHTTSSTAWSISKVLHVFNEFFYLQAYLHFLLLWEERRENRPAIILTSQIKVILNLRLLQSDQGFHKAHCQSQTSLSYRSVTYLSTWLRRSSLIYHESIDWSNVSLFCWAKRLLQAIVAMVSILTQSYLCRDFRLPPSTLLTILGKYTNTNWIITRSYNYTYNDWSV